MDANADTIEPILHWVAVSRRGEVKRAIAPPKSAGADELAPSIANRRCSRSRRITCARDCGSR